jgi:serine/threonine protein kinase
MKVVLGRFCVGRKIGSGSFGEIYAGVDRDTNQGVAIKLEVASASRSTQVGIEAKIYKILEGGVGIPRVFAHGQESKYNILVMDRLGESLEDIYARRRTTFSLKTVLMIVEQTLSQVQFVHSRNILHRDIKPDNFLVGLDDRSSTVHIIDFGLSHYYRDPRTGNHIGLGRHKSLTGTARYASRNAMRGLEQSRRDDLESLGYVWMYLLRGSLPWQGIPARTQDEKMAKILDMKVATSFESLCQGFPTEFLRYFEIVTELPFDEEPDYAGLRRMFRELFIREGNVYDSRYDWSKDPVRPTHSDGDKPAGPRLAELRPGKRDEAPPGQAGRANFRVSEGPGRVIIAPIASPKAKKKRQGPAIEMKAVALPRLCGSRRQKPHLC